MKFIENSLDLRASEILKIMQEQTKQSTYFGIRSRKYPNDFWIYQEIISERRPDVIIEIGVKRGGTTLALAHICDILKDGTVIGIDKNLKYVARPVRKHRRVLLLEGLAIDLLGMVEKLIANDERAIIIEDSSHTYENTLGVLRAYSKFVKKDDYFIVEDGICHHGINYGPNPGPYEAIKTFLKENTDFVSDRSRERFFITSNPTGFLRRTR